jgi:hypothetical protein
MTICVLNAEKRERQLFLRGKQTCALLLLALGDTEQKWQAFDAVRTSLVQNYFGLPRHMRSGYVSIPLYEGRAKKMMDVVQECADMRMRSAGTLLTQLRGLYA